MRCKIIERIVIIRTFEDGSTLELNRIQWGTREPEYDLRVWKADGTHKSGYALKKAHVSALKKALDIRKEI